ncbi:MAG: hypothetical protein U0223_11660 [Nitrospira sp.]|nr:hypothetical protein [Nitrospira sp.]
MEAKDIKTFEDMERAHNERLMKAIEKDQALRRLVEIYVSSKKYREKFQEVVRQHTVEDMSSPNGVPREDE